MASARRAVEALHERAQRGRPPLEEARQLDRRLLRDLAVEVEVEVALARPGRRRRSLPRRRRARAPTAAAPRATAATPATRTQAVRFFMASPLSPRPPQVVGAAPRLGQRRRWPGTPRSAGGRRAPPPGVRCASSSVDAEPHQRVVARHGRAGVVHDLPIALDGLVPAAAAAVEVGQGQARQAAARAASSPPAASSLSSFSASAVLPSSRRPAPRSSARAGPLGDEPYRFATLVERGRGLLVLLGRGREHRAAGLGGVRLAGHRRVEDRERLAERASPPRPAGATGRSRTRPRPAARHGHRDDA